LEAGSVRQGGAKHIRLAKLVADDLLALFQDFGFATRGEFLRHDFRSVRTLPDGLFTDVITVCGDCQRPDRPKSTRRRYLSATRAKACMRAELAVDRKTTASQ
jgi:hypothetical protein